MINIFAKLFLCFLFCFCLNLDAGVAVFKQDNAQVWIEDCRKLSLLEENVSVTLKVADAENPLVTKDNGSVWLSVQSIIKIKNLQDSELTATLGFPLCAYPLNLKSHEKTSAKSVFEKNLGKLDFIVTVNDNEELKTNFFLEDRERLFCSIFLWEIKLAPKEVQSFIVSYSVPLLHIDSFLSGDLLRNSESIKLDSTTELLYRGLSTCKNLFFSYAVLDKYLYDEGSKRISINFDLSMVFDKFNICPNIWNCVHLPDPIKFNRYLIVLLEPKMSKMNNKIIGWDNPNESCFVHFKRTSFPFHSSDWESCRGELITERKVWLNNMEKIFKQNTGLLSGESKQYYLDKLELTRRLKNYPFLERDLDDIYSAFLGGKINNKNIDSFLKKQIWFSYSKLTMNNWILLWE